MCVLKLKVDSKIIAILIVRVGVVCHAAPGDRDGVIVDNPNNTPPTTKNRGAVMVPTKRAHQR